MLRRRTVLRTSAALKLSNGMLTPLVPLLRIEANTSWQSMVIDLVMVTAPKPPGSRQLISPLSAVLEMAPAKVLHGAVRLHGLASSPTPDTQVREAWACAGAACSRTTSDVAASASNIEVLGIVSSELGALDQSKSVILRRPSVARPSKDGPPGPSPFEARTQPSLRRLRRLACGLAPQGDGERASSVPSLTETKPARSGTCFPPARLRDTCRSRTPRRPGWSGRQTRRWPRLRRRW